VSAITRRNGQFSVTAHRGDAKTLLAFNHDKAHATRLAGFTIHCAPEGVTPYYILNTLRFEDPSAHAQDSQEPANSSINAPIHKFRWLHIPGSAHQGVSPVRGKYTYTVTPRYFDADASLLPMDPALSVSVSVDVVPFERGAIELGFTRGFTQSQAFVHHFGLKAPLRPTKAALIYDTSANAGKNAAGEQYSFADEYVWLGYTGREKVFAMLDFIAAKKTRRLDMFAYDLNEPDVMHAVLDLAHSGRVRMILDDASLHHTAGKQGGTSKPEDQFDRLFSKEPNGVECIVRGHFGRYSHDKVMIAYDGKEPVKVLTGSTNFSLTGLYVNSNHVVIFNDPKVAKTYADVFEEAWRVHASGTKAFATSPLAAGPASFKSKTVPDTRVTFSPHTADEAAAVLTNVADRIAAESDKGKRGSVLFAVMSLSGGGGPVLPALTKLHSAKSVFSYGISDSPGGIVLYSPKHLRGLLVTGKPKTTVLPAPFDQVPGVRGHQVHHKFVVCGFNRPDAVVFCGSSNLAEGGEKANGDNLIEIHDPDVATAFAIEALALVDHFDFLDRYQHAPKGKKKPPAAKSAAAAEAGWFLSSNDGWAKPYFDAKDLRSVDRLLFA
jgi:hypothetical protein